MITLYRHCSENSILVLPESVEEFNKVKNGYSGHSLEEIALNYYFAKVHHFDKLSVLNERRLLEFEEMMFEDNNLRKEFYGVVNRLEDFLGLLKS